MSRQESPNTLARQWELLRLLPNKAPGLTATQLHEKLSTTFDVSLRTVQRDLERLEVPFFLTCNDKGTPHGWYWQEGFKVDLPGMTIADALSLMLVEQSLPKLLPEHLAKALTPRFNHARDKLKALENESPTARWANKVASVNPQLDMQAPSIKEDVLTLIQEALLTDRQIRAQYYSVSKGELQTLTLNPLALIQRGLSLYLIATAASYTDVRQYVLHRFETVEILEHNIENQTAFDLQAYLKSGALQFNAGNMIQLIAQVDNTLAKLLEETPIANDMQLKPTTNGFELSASVRDSWQLEWWILQQGPSISVRAPTELRDRIIHKVRQTLEGYSGCQA